jgi:hypothetical protein
MFSVCLLSIVPGGISSAFSTSRFQKPRPTTSRSGRMPHLDPFISERKVKRWDVSCELFSVAVTLHEMTTGVLPQWGDGRSDPASIKRWGHDPARTFRPRSAGTVRAIFRELRGTGRPPDRAPAHARTAFRERTGQANAGRLGEAAKRDGVVRVQRVCLLHHLFLVR